jgi:hypothetical protein
MEFTDEYVHVNNTNAVYTSNGALEVVISYDSNRPPYALVEVASATVLSANTNPRAFILMTEEIANNLHNTANRGTSLAIMPYYTQVAANNHNYDLLGVSARASFSNARTLHLYFTDHNGVTVNPTAGVILGFNVLLKISRPSVGSITAAYRTQIPL